MARPVRLIAALVLAAMCLHVTWLRTPVERGSPKDIVFDQIAGVSETGTPGWQVEGVWHYHTEPNLRFGGYSAILPISGSRLRAWSDRGFLFTFTEPNLPFERPSDRIVSRQQLADPALYWELWDIESVTRDPESGDFWLGYENGHVIHRFSFQSQPEDWRSLADEVDWNDNGGLEAMVRLDDGRFLIVPEGRDEALIFASDPVEGGAPQTIPFATPAESFAVTDMAQLPDGRVLLLMRNVVWDFPPFEALLAIAEPPQMGTSAAWSPEVILPLDGILPPENYEGLGLRALAEDGDPQDDRIAVWIISDDNLAAIQRTLVAKLIFDPDAATQN